ncbi:MAG: FGGY-family carbohydrate kinase [Betaproteobacteria bacterium]
MEHVIGVDIGTQSTKALLCDARGRIVAQHAIGYHPDTPRPSWAEQSASVWLDAVERAIRGCLDAAARADRGFLPVSVRAVCVSGLYGGSGVPIDAAMQPTHPCLIWMDRRATAEVDWVRAHLDMDRLYDITGNGVDSYYGYTKMMWLRDHRSEAFARTRWFVPPNAFVVHALTGELAVDRSSAGNIGGVYDYRNACWSEPMLAALGIPVSMMPSRLVASTEVVGTVTAAAAARTGLAVGTKVVAGGVDAAVATLAAGVTSPGHHVAMIGTSMCWGFVSPTVDARHGLVSMPYVFGDDLYVFGGAITAGSAVTWFVNEFCRDLGAMGDPAAATRALVTLEAEARDVPEGADGIVFLPYLMGERSPIWDARASGAFVGLNLFHRREHAYRAVLEGVSFALRDNIEAGMRGAARLDERLVVVGGAARSDLWMQIIADVSGRPVHTIEEDVEAAMGSALLAAYAVGLCDGDGVRRGWVTLTERALPRPAASARYDEVFAVYKALYPSLRDSMHALANGAAAHRTPA